MIAIDQFLDAVGRDKIRKKSGGGWKASCPAHEDKHASMTIAAGDDGRALVTCWAGCQYEEIIRAVNLTSTASPFPRRPPKPRLPDPPPVPDRDRLIRFMTMAVENVLEGRADEWLKSRGISKSLIERVPTLGFVLEATVEGWSFPLRNSWAIMVQDPDGTPRAVKLHRENTKAKGLWMPFGTEPADAPRHGYAALWPCPEFYPANETLYILPGELKAAAMRSAGFNATSITTGEAFTWTPEFVSRMSGRDLVLVYDDDPAGHKFKDKTISALENVRAVTFGKAAA